MTRRKPCTLGYIASRFGGELIGDGKISIRGIASLESAGAHDISFIAHPRYLPQLKQTAAAAVVLGPEGRNATALPRIISSDPYLYFARLSEFLNPPAAIKAGRHKTATIARTAKIARSASIGAGVVIGQNVKLGERVVIGPACVIGDAVTIGADTRLHGNATVYHECVIGARCLIHSGVVIGSDGFGLALENGVWRKIPQIGRVVIGDDVEIGANTAIDRGALDDTVIEDGVKLDNLIQIAHNVRVGAHTAIAACVGIAGSAKIGSHCQLGGAAMIYGHITIADHVNVSAGTLVMKSLNKAGTYTGVFPFSSHERWLKNAAQLRQLDQLAARVRELERKLGKTERNMP